VRWENNAEPVAGDVLRAVVRARDPDGEAVEVTFDWEVGGLPRGETGPEIEVPRVRKGTPIEVTATASDGFAESEPARRAVRVRNQRPKLSQARIEPWETVDVGEVDELERVRIVRDHRQGIRLHVRDPVRRQGEAIEVGPNRIGNMGEDPKAARSKVVSSMKSSSGISMP